MTRWWHPQIGYAGRIRDYPALDQHRIEIGVIQSFGNAVNQSIETLTRLGRLAKSSANRFGAAMRALVQAVGFVADHFNQIKAALAGLIAFKAAQFFISLAAEVWNVARAAVALNVAMLANPFGLIATAVAAVIGALVLYQGELDSASSATSSIGAAIRGVWDAAREAVAGFADGFNEIEKAAPVAAIQAFQRSRWFVSGRATGC